MEIVIRYDSCWRNSFLSGSNNKSLVKRDFIGSGKKLKESPENYKETPISADTVMGVLNRLIGDQHKLYQARQRPDYYFKKIEDDGLMTFKDECVISKELVYLRNVSGNTDESEYAGLIDDQHHLLTSPSAKELWGVLWMPQPDLESFLVAPTVNASSYLNGIALTPAKILEKINLIPSKRVELIAGSVLEKAVSILLSAYPVLDKDLDKSGILVKNNPKTKKDEVSLKTLILQALNKQLASIKLLDVNFVQSLSREGYVPGLSKSGFSFTEKDFLGHFTPGKKLVLGNPYVQKVFLKGEGEIRNMLQKASGTLRIELNISEEAADDLRIKINEAGVSAFTLGKKGLAYVERC